MSCNCGKRANPENIRALINARKDNQNKVLINFTHGLGDSTQLTSILKHLCKHRPDWLIDVQSGRGKHSLFNDLCRNSYVMGQAPMPEYGQIFDLTYPECHVTYKDYPSTKTTKCLKDIFGIDPEIDLLRYTISIRDGARERVKTYLASLPPKDIVILHYQGNTNNNNKDLSHIEAMTICQWLLAKGYVPVILDFDKRCQFIDNKNIFCPDVNNPLWMGYGIGDGETIAALIEQSKLVIAVDSGPLHVAISTKTPTIGVWTKHHPIHYVDLNDGLHLVPASHKTLIRGNLHSFFEENYNYQIYDNLVQEVIKQSAKILDQNLLTSKKFDDTYYKQHKLAGLDYCNHGEWQKSYAAWLIDALQLKGKMLDVGCACGSINHAFNEAGIKSIGIDLNEYMIHLGRNKFRDELHVVDAINLHIFDDETFDFVHANQSFEHFKPELVSNILHELSRVTKPGGRLFTVLDTQELYTRQDRDVAKEDATHACIKSLEWWNWIIKLSGWKVLDKNFLVAHPKSYFTTHDWDAFLMEKIS